jgi:hypothetical protein
MRNRARALELSCAVPQSPLLYVNDQSKYLSRQLKFPHSPVDVDNQTQLSVTGVDSDNYAVRFCAQAGGPSEDDARRSLEQITFTRSGQTLKIRKARQSRGRPASAWLHIEAARHSAISLKGSYSYMELFGIGATLQISTTHGRLKMIEISDTVRATARVGIIDFAGERGRIQLESDGEIGAINLKFAAPLFDGTVRAEAEVAIRVLLPPKSGSPFEAIVGREDLFVCRADIAPHVRRHDYEGRVVFTYGIGDPVLRLVSHSALVIDSIDRLPSKSR